MLRESHTLNKYGVGDPGRNTPKSGDFGEPGAGMYHEVNETGWLLFGLRQDSVEQVTITHKESFPVHFLDTTKNIIRQKYVKFNLTEDETNPPIIFDTLQKIGDR